VDGIDGSDVGTYQDGFGRQGSAGSQWALGRYLVGRAVAEALSRGLMVVAVVVFGLAALVEWAGSTFWTVVIALVAVGVLILRSLLLAVLRRLPLMTGDASVEQRLRRLVADTRRDVLRELRRIGLPGRTVSIPLLATRLIGKHRNQTLDKLQQFDVDRVVPAARLDELHLLLQSGPQRPAS
jgi:hypothetical protein